MQAHIKIGLFRLDFFSYSGQIIYCKGPIAQLVEPPAHNR